MVVALRRADVDIAAAGGERVGGVEAERGGGMDIMFGDAHSSRLRPAKHMGRAHGLIYMASYRPPAYPGGGGEGASKKTQSNA